MFSQSLKDKYELRRKLTQGSGTLEEGGSGSVEGIGQSERHKYSLSDKIAVDEVLQLLGELHGGAGVSEDEDEDDDSNAYEGSDDF